MRSTRRVAAPGSEFAGFRFPSEVITLAGARRVLPAAQHITARFENNRIEADHGYSLMADLDPAGRHHFGNVAQAKL